MLTKPITALAIWPVRDIPTEIPQMLRLLKDVGSQLLETPSCTTNLHSGVLALLLLFRDHVPCSILFHLIECQPLTANLS